MPWQRSTVLLAGEHFRGGQEAIGGCEMDDDCCFVCTNELDATDTSISFCECDLALCLW